MVEKTSGNINKKMQPTNPNAHTHDSGTEVERPRSAKCKQYTIECKAENVKCKMWSAECGAQSVECSVVCSVECKVY